MFSQYFKMHWSEDIFELFVWVVIIILFYLFFLSVIRHEEKLPNMMNIDKVIWNDFDVNNLYFWSRFSNMKKK